MKKRLCVRALMTAWALGVSVGQGLGCAARAPGTPAPVAAATSTTDAPTREDADGSDAIMGLAGCYLVDHSFVETQAQAQGYIPDPRVYDATADKAVLEWITAERLRAGRIWVQHILFARDAQGALLPGFLLKHQAEDWVREANTLWAFHPPAAWYPEGVVALPAQAGEGPMWVRKITDLDDGPRFQCAGRWQLQAPHPSFACAGLSPVPGRESRDMERRDYTSLYRRTRMVHYGTSWLERQHNLKRIDRLPEGPAEMLVAEQGKSWYVRLDDEACAPARDFAAARAPFWQLVREVWDTLYAAHTGFVVRPSDPSKMIEASPASSSTLARLMAMAELEEDALSCNLQDADVRAALARRIEETLRKYISTSP